MQRWLGVLPLLMLLWGQAQAADIEAGKAKAALIETVEFAIARGY